MSPETNFPGKIRGKIEDTVRVVPAQVGAKEITTYSTGAIREKTDNKPRIGLISPFAQIRCGEWMRHGSQHYGDRNWEKGIPTSHYVESIERHIQKYKLGLTDEDHVSAVAVNAQMLIHTEEMIKLGKLPAELDDLPKYLKGEKEWTI
jgi:hypothetical protein